jgi:hypothetical protein
MGHKNNPFSFYHLAYPIRFHYLVHGIEDATLETKIIDLPIEMAHNMDVTCSVGIPMFPPLQKPSTGEDISKVADIPFGIRLVGIAAVG